MRIPWLLALLLGSCGSSCGSSQPSPPSEPTLLPGAHEAHEKGRLTARPHPPRGAPGEHGVLPLGLGGDRDGRVFVPSGYDPSRPSPLFLLLHGAGGSSERILRPFRDRAEKQGVILLVPDSRGTTWDIVNARHFGADVPFLDRALASAFDRWNIDPARVAIGGFSDGASYGLSIGLGNGDLFTSILAFSPGFVEPDVINGRPRVFISHGTADQILQVGVSRRLVPVLQGEGYDVLYVEFAGGHSLPDEVLDTAFAWLLRP